MRLLVYKIDGVPVNEMTTSYSQDDLGGNDLYKFIPDGDAVPEGYEDITDIYSLHKWGGSTRRDYKFVRDQIKQMVVDLGSGDEDAGFLLLPVEGKLVCCEHKIGSHALREAVVGTSNLVLFGLQYHKQVTEARQVRAAYVTSILWNRLPNNAQEVLEEVISLQDNMFITYVFFGREGTVEGDPEGITDWLYGRAGTSFENTGLLQKNWTPSGMTMEELVDTIYDIAHNGNYEL